MIQKILLSYTTMVAYYYFNWQYFVLVTTALRLPSIKKGYIIGSFILNYLQFFVCSLLELNLIINWLLFFLILFVETLLYCKDNWQGSLYFSLAGIFCGLVINIFCRCMVSIITGYPLSSFDNRISISGNLKWLPVFLGFLIGGIVLQRMKGQRFINWFYIFMNHPKQLLFQLELIGGMLLYLNLNLMLYQSQDNGLLLKIWGVKSCIFTTVGAYLGVRYSLHVCKLFDYRIQNRAIQQELMLKEQEEKKLHNIAFIDTLTGAYNRQYGLHTITRLLKEQSQFCVCFVDLNNLKVVNDTYGHGEGDRYIVIVAQELLKTCRKNCDWLFRYGGDEFLILYSHIPVPVIEEYITQVNKNLKELSKEVPFSMSVSYGIICNDNSMDAQTLIGLADKKMYLQKIKNHL